MSIKILSPRRAAVHARILVDLPGESHPEEMLGDPLGHDRFKLINIPFRAMNVSYGDVVLAEESGRKFRMMEILRRGGHSTYRLRIEWALIDRFLENHWRAFELLDCTYEGKKGDAFDIAMDVPLETQLGKIETLLEKGRKIGLLRWSPGFRAI